MAVPEQLASAVIVPQDVASDTEEQLSATNGADHAATAGTKRRQNSASSQDSKRPRLSVDAEVGTGNVAPPTGDSLTSNATPSAPSFPGRERIEARRRARAQGNEEQDKDRAKRMFGALARGGLMRVSGPGNQRASLDGRPSARIREQQTEPPREVDLEALKQKRQTQQRKWDEQSMRLRHQQMRSTAKFLKTVAQPPVYYLPYAPTSEQQRILDEQARQTEDEIKRELEAFDQQTQPDEAEIPEVAAAKPDGDDTVKMSVVQGTGDTGLALDPGAPKPEDTSEVVEHDAAQAASSGDPLLTEATAVDSTRSQAAASAIEEKTADMSDEHDDDHVVEAGEDSVIY